MKKPKKSAVRFVSMLLAIASLMQSNLQASYAQSTGATNQNTYFIQGAVNKPGVYQIESSASLVNLLTLAGGLSSTHGTAAFIMRRLPAQSADQNPTYQVIQVRLDELLRGNRESVNLKPGDIVNIPQADVFYVSGEVKAPGSFKFTKGVTLLQGIASAGGLTSSAKPGSVLIFRQDPGNGKRQEIKVDLDAVTSGKQKDFPLLPNDIVMIPRSRSRTLLWPQFLDAPPTGIPGHCRGSRPCIARLGLRVFDPAYDRD